MATILSCDGQSIIVNMDNCDFMKLVAYKIEFYRHNPQSNAPSLMCVWTFSTNEERNVAYKGIMKEHGSHIKTKE